MKIWFDMDGTIADLYGVENWLEMLITENEKPYEIAKPLINLSLLARYLNKIQAQGNEIGIISWLSRNSTKEYDAKVELAKKEWLAKHLKSVKWNEIKIVSYGMSKWEICKSGILFDDEEKNRKEWKEASYKPEQIFEILKREI